MHVSGGFILLISFKQAYSRNKSMLPSVAPIFEKDIFAKTKIDNTLTNFHSQYIPTNKHKHFIFWSVYPFLKKFYSKQIKVERYVQVTRKFMFILHTC